MGEQSEDWRHCMNWIIRCKVLEDDHRLMKEGIQVFDFAQTIRDGVILCHLLNALKPSTIDSRDFSPRPQMSQFLISKNIRVFLTSCVNVFQMNISQLFEIVDLFEYKDFSKVLKCLSILSNTSEAKKSGIKGFHVGGNNSDYYALTASEHSNEDDYSKFDDKIYQDLCSIKKQESMRESSLPVSQMTKREYCIKELVDTEANYLKALDMIITSFQKPLETKLAPEDSKTLFQGIELLRTTHMCFKQDLATACKSRHGSIRQSSHMTISDCFVKWKERFLAYGNYCSNLPKVQAILDRLQTNPAAMNAITECQQNANGGRFRLRDLLSIPMQRVLKYHLLLKELLKNTDEFHPERQGLQKALEEMQDLASYVNETKRDNENLQWIQDVQESIVNLEKTPQLQTYGRLHKDGELKAKSSTDKRERIYFFFLFDYLLLRCKSKGNDTYSFKEHYQLENFEVEEIHIGNTKDKFCFQMVHIESKEVVIMFCAKTNEIKDKWIECFKTAATNRIPPYSKTVRHDFVMTSFTEPSICDVCRKLLRGVFFQGYKCKQTNMVVHKDCIEKAKNLSGPPVLPPKQATGNRVKAISSYHGEPAPPDGRPPLTFEENDVFLVITMDELWWMGRHLGKEGYFPKKKKVPTATLR